MTPQKKICPPKTTAAARIEITSSPIASTTDTIKKPNEYASHHALRIYLTNMEDYTTSLSVEIEHMGTSLDTVMSAPDLPRPATALNHFVSTLWLEHLPRRSLSLPISPIAVPPKGHFCPGTPQPTYPLSFKG